MAMFNGGGLTAAQVTSKVQNRLIALQQALEAVEDLYGWASGVASADLTAIGFATTDASALLSAIADANALARIYRTGQPPATYPQAASAYPYGASQHQVTGPQLCTLTPTG